jgi:hypothetical protein
VIAGHLAIVVAAGAGAGGFAMTAWALITGHHPPSWFGFACAAVPAPFLLWRTVRSVAWRVRSPHADRARVVELKFGDTRAWHVHDGDRLEGYLFVVDMQESVFLCGQWEWLPPSEAEFEEAIAPDGGVSYVVPERLRLVLGVAGDGTCTELERNDEGPLRWIPDADEAAVDAVKSFTRDWALGRLEGFVPTPESLLRPT